MSDPSERGAALGVVDYEFARDGCCRAQVWQRDTYRYSGRGPGGFSLHYNRRQCQRAPLADSAYCWQHAAERKKT